jgi:stage II sporulation protein R
MVGKRLLVFILAIATVVGVGRVAMAGRMSNTATPTEVNLAVPNQAPIPHEALRLRIIANSDSERDQELKREVRDAVVVACGRWLKAAHSPEEARAIVQKHISDIRSIAQRIVYSKGVHYPVHTTVGKEPFPTKIYGNRVYPAGEYEALYIVIGKGSGQNWWCVLFPPLCFVDIADGDAVPNTGGFPDLPPLETIQVPNQDGKPTSVAVRLASVDYGEELIKAVQHWFGSKS